MARSASKKVLDTKTGKEYPSMYKAGLALYKLAPDGSKEDHFVWYKIVKAHPKRFKIKEAGQKGWMAVAYAGKAAKVVKPVAVIEEEDPEEEEENEDGEEENDQESTGELEEDPEDEEDDEAEEEAELERQLKASAKLAKKGKKVAA